MKCPKCQAENKGDADFCNECGTKVEVACPKCGRLNRPGSKFCDKCGQNMAKAAVLAPVDYSLPQSYTPKFLAEKILKDRSSLEGERKLVTVLFADVANYTAMSEKLDSEECHQIMDGCFRILMDEIHRYEGTINQFTGDGVMALFGAPVAHEDHALRACHAALAIQRAIGEYGDKVKRDCGVDFKMRMGLNSGSVVVGSIGNDLRMDYTAQGDTTNLASRMQGLAQLGSILVAPDTYRLSRDFFEFQTLGKTPVKGKEQPVEAYQLLKAAGVATRIEAAMAKGLTKFVGREKEMAVLRETFEKAKSGSGQVVGIVGDAGVGKSRLVLELRQMLAQDEYHCLEGHCLHYGSSMPYVPLLDILRAYFDITEGEREFLVKKKMAEKISRLDEKLKNALPPLRDLFSLKVEDEAYQKLEPQKKRERIFEAIRDLLIRESQSKPLVVAIDDLHWIDRTSNEFLNYFIGWLANSHILLVLLYRPEYVHQWGSKSYYGQIRVEQLSASASAELVRAMLEEGEVAPELRQLILNRAAGNPLFMEEFTHTLLENGSIGKKDHQYVLTRKASDIQVPDTIQGIIAARMDRLEENLKRTMQVASVIGRDFAYRILLTITGMQEDLKSHLMNLQGLEFIYEKSLFPELEYMFKHTLTQEVAYNSLLVKRRKELHEKTAEAIEELYPDKLEEFYEALAYHYLMGENCEKAHQYLLSSSIKVSTRNSLWEAFHLGKEALNVLSKMPQTQANRRKGIDTRLPLALVTMAIGYPEDSLEILQEGERLSREMADEKALARFHSSVGMCHTMKGDAELGTRYLEEAFHMAEEAQDIELMAPIGFDFCVHCLTVGETEKVAEVAPKVIDFLERTRRESESFGTLGFNPYTALVSSYGFSLAHLGNFEEAETQCQKALRFATVINDVSSMGYAECMYGMLLGIKGDGEKAVEHSQEAVKYLEETNIVTLLGTAWANLGWGYHLLGDPVTAVNHMKKGLEICSGLEGTPALSTGAYMNLGAVYLGSGDLDNARRCAEKVLELAQKWHMSWQELYAQAMLKGIAAVLDSSRFAEAEEYIVQLIKVADEHGWRVGCAEGYLNLGLLAAAVGQRDKAVEALDKAEGMFREMGMSFWLVSTQSVRKMLQV